MVETGQIMYEDLDNVKFLVGNYKVLLLVFENFMYKRINGNKPRTTWKCTSSKSGCFASVITYDGKFESASPVDEHCHSAPIDEIKVIETKMHIKRRVASEFNLTPRQIHREGRTKLLLQNDKYAHLLMNSFPKCKSSLYRYRQEIFPAPPASRSDISLQNEWNLTLDRKETFTLINHGTTNRILVFGTVNNLKILCKSDYVVSDGTFKVHPGIFPQLYVFHAPYLSKVLPLLFCLLPDKSKETYVNLLRLIQERATSFGLTFCPPKIVIDYESAMIAAVRITFPGIRIQGCLFHYSQCIWRKVQELGMKRAYTENVNVRRWIRRFAALPFLPMYDVDDGFIEICENAPEPSQDTISVEQIVRFHDYMVDTWIDDINSLFHRSLWNQYTNNDGPRTTNNAEVWNNKLNWDAKTRLTFFQFFHFLKCMQADLDVTKFDLISESPSAQSARVRSTNRLIDTAKQNYKTGNVEILKYLDSVSCAIKLE